MRQAVCPSTTAGSKHEGVGKLSRIALSAGMFALLAIMGQPVSAGTHVADVQAVEQRSAAFAGLNIRMPLGVRATTRPDARLKLGVTHRLSSGRSGMTDRVQDRAVLELGLARTGKPLLFLAGQDTAKVESKLGVNGTETALLIAGGVLLAAGGAFLLFADSGPTVCFPDGSEEATRCERELD